MLSFVSATAEGSVMTARMEFAQSILSVVDALLAEGGCRGWKKKGICVLQKRLVEEGGRGVGARKSARADTTVI